MNPFLFRFAVTPAPAPTAKLVYLPHTRSSFVSDDSNILHADGTLITKSHEAHDQTEVIEELCALASEGTLLTCTREAKDAVERSMADIEIMASSMETSRTGSVEHRANPWHWPVERLSAS